MVTCPSCGINTSFCPKCGFPLMKNSTICDSCKQKINYCFNCNAPLREIVKETLIPTKPPIIKKPPTIPLKSCFFHPRVEAIAKCDACDRLLCKDCAKKFGNLILCPEDYPKNIEIIRYIHPVRKYPKNALILFSFSMILFILQIFFINYQILFLEKILFISAKYMVYALLIICASMVASIILIVKSNHPTLGSFMAMFTSLISLFFGGGFFIGSILGVAGGLISMVES